MIKAIIFDYGGIFTKEGSFRKFAKRYGREFTDDPEGFLEVVYKSWKEPRVGKVDSYEFWKAVAKFVNEDVESFRRKFIDMFGTRPEMIEFVKELKKKYKLGMITNAIEDWFEENRKRDNLNELFDVIITSYEFKNAKPDLKIFKECVRKLGVNSSECVYVDDLEKNIPPAKKLGMKVILFKDMEQFKKELAVTLK